MKKYKLYTKVKKALELAPHILVDQDKVTEATGFPYMIYADLGLNKNDLKQLEKGGLAVSGYYPTKEGWKKHFILVRRTDG